MKRYDLIVVGAGPAGLSAAIEAAKRGLEVIVFDENAKPGGQLFKQIHKFFGSKEHKAKIRGYKIGETLLDEANLHGVKVVLNAIVVGLYLDREVTVKIEDTVVHYKADAIIVATGASENMVPFEGWTLPGVIGAGAAQTMMNLYNIKPGSKVLMLGSGNVGLVVSYQLIQAGCEVVAVVDASPKIGGYGVHASKITRCGVPFYLSHTIMKAHGDQEVTGVTIGQVDSNWQVVKGTEKTFDADTICLAVGLSPMSQLLKMAGCEMVDSATGYVPVTHMGGRTSVDGIFACGDVSGIEEASAAMIEGRISGIEAARHLGFIADEEAILEQNALKDSLGCLREGMFAPENRGKSIEITDEGIQISKQLLAKGYLEDELERFPGITDSNGIRPVIECTQNIPCNPCQDACSQACIKIGDKITALPIVDESRKCTGCGLCVAACSGQAIFLVDENYEPGYATVTLPYEFYPLPIKGMQGVALDRSGSPVCKAEVVQIRSSKAYDNTHLLTMKIPVALAMQARFFSMKEVNDDSFE